jgi:drug/metabolite transporter (DMT)-like permease
MRTNLNHSSSLDGHGDLLPGLAVKLESFDEHVMLLTGPAPRCLLRAGLRDVLVFISSSTPFVLLVGEWERFRAGWSTWTYISLAKALTYHSLKWIEHSIVICRQAQEMRRICAKLWLLLLAALLSQTRTCRAFVNNPRTVVGRRADVLPRRATPLPGEVETPGKTLAGATRQSGNGVSSGKWPPSFNINLSRTQALVLLVAISAIYGTNYTAIKVMDDAFLDPYFSTLLRFAIATVVFTPVMLKAVRRGRSDVIIGGMEVGLLNGFGYLFQALSLQQPGSSASSVAFISSLSCIVVPLLDWLVPAVKGEEGQKFKVEKIYPALLALGGVAFLELNDVSGSQLFSHSTLAAATQPLFFGIAFYRLERVIKRCSEPAHFSAFTGGNQLSVLLVSLVWFVVEVVSVASERPTEFLAVELALCRGPVLFSLLWTGFITTAGAALLESLAVKKLPASEVAIVYTTEPLWGTAAAAFFLGEAIHANTIVGGILIVSACLLSQSQGAVRAISAATAGKKEL